MPRLFSAFELPNDVRDELADRLAGVGAPDLSWEPRERWHITLGFYGDGEDVDRRSDWLRERVATHVPVQVRLLAAGQFPGVLWVGVDALDEEHTAGLRELGRATADSKDQREFVPHVTVARWKKRQPVGGEAATRVAAALDGYRGQWWLTDEVVLFRSDLTPDGPVYTAVDRVALAGAPGKQC